MTKDVVDDGFQFYTTFFNAPPAITVRNCARMRRLAQRPERQAGADKSILLPLQALLHGMVGVGLVGLISKLHKWDESAMFFDGTSLGMFFSASGCLICGILTCVYVCGSAAAYMFSIAVYLTVTIPALKAIVTPLEAADYTPEDEEDKVQAIRVLSAGNIIVIVCLGAILFLQVCVQLAGDMYLRRWN